MLIFTGYGINADKELAWAFELAGGEAHIKHISDIIEKKSMISDYQIIAFPGGFSFGDHIASGKVFANLVKHNLMDEISKFIDKENLVIGICNGFQIITKLGIVPDFDNKKEQDVSLVENESGKFEDRWVWADIVNKKSPWLKNIDKMYLPVRHGEGKLVIKEKEILTKLKKKDQIAIKYVKPGSDIVDYPYNPNGSEDNIAGILNEKGNVFGLMPHPEAYIFFENHPDWVGNKECSGVTGLEIFNNGINYFS